jgi:hypothetical protein
MIYTRAEKELAEAIAMNSERDAPLSEGVSEQIFAPCAYRIGDLCLLTGLGRTTIYAAIKSGALIARRYRRCTVVLAEDLAAFLRNLPTTR